MSYFSEFNKEFSGRISRALSSVSPEELERAAEILIDTHKRNARIFVIGNGGSWSMAGHWVADLNKTVFNDRLNTAAPRFRAVRLPATVEELTAWGNDIGYEMVFAGPLTQQASSGDILIAISSSGTSSNIVRALDVAKEKEMRIIGLSGFSGGPLREFAEAKLHVATEKGEYEVVETVHDALMHLLINYLRRNPQLFSHAK